MSVYLRYIDKHYTHSNFELKPFQSKSTVLPIVRTHFFWLWKYTPRKCQAQFQRRWNFTACINLLFQHLHSIRFDVSVHCVPVHSEPKWLIVIMGGTGYCFLQHQWPRDHCFRHTEFWNMQNMLTHGWVNLYLFPNSWSVIQNHENAVHYNYSTFDQLTHPPTILTIISAISLPYLRTCKVSRRRVLSSKASLISTPGVCR